MEFYKIQLILFFMSACFTLHFVECEYFTSMAEMEKLLYTEGRIAHALENYLKMEEERLQKVRRLTEQYKTLDKLVDHDVNTFLSNPVNAYLLVKRLTADWDATNQLIASAESKALINNISEENFPSTEDLSGAATALIRLQNMYLLDHSTIASGQIKETKSADELYAGDCYELGLQACNNHDYLHCLAWMKEAWKRVQKENVLTANKVEVLEYLAYSHYAVGNFSAAVDATFQIMSIDPHNAHAPTNLQFYNKAKNEYNSSATETGGDQSSTSLNELPSLEDWPEHLLHPTTVDRYEKLCRGESLKTKQEESQLNCYYTTNNNSYLFLQPVKVEVLNLDPRIVMFFDVINEKESNAMKAFSLPILGRATVNNGTSGENKFADHRISKSTWLHDFLHPMVPKLNQRLSDITGLDTFNAEPLHVINYGIGGHYQPHFDFAKPDDKGFFFDLGNRIATWIYYLSDVTAGGSTVFPEAGVEVKPVKGAAVFWYNLFRNGKGNRKTRHAACPVLLGSKWIANKWLHEKGNEFIRRCSLDPNE